MGELIPGARRRTLHVHGLAFTAYEMGEGPIVLCVHGFPDTPATWRHLLPELAASGFRAVAVTLRGYEASSQSPDGDFGLATLVDDVLGWIEALGAERAHLVGHDWGSTLVQLAAARAPEKVASLTALAVAHPAAFAPLMMSDFEQLERSWYIFLFQAPDLADALLRGPGFLQNLWRRWSPGWTPDPEVLAAAQAAFAEPQVAASALAYYRRGFDPTHPRAAEAQALMDRTIPAPLLALSGVRDGCVASELFAQAFPEALFTGRRRVAAIPEAGHFLQLEATATVNAMVVQWASAREREL